MLILGLGSAFALFAREQATAIRQELLEVRPNEARLPSTTVSHHIVFQLRTVQ